MTSTPADPPFWRFFSAGVEVWSPSTLPDLPQQASMVGLVATIIDEGAGPKACYAVRMSRPPQGGGPYVDGLVMDRSWTETARGITWGRRTITITWPPDDGRVELLEEGPVEDRRARRRFDDRGVDRRYSDAELGTAMGQLAAVPYDETYLYAARSETTSNRAIASVLVADGSVASRLARAVDDAGILVIEGAGVILAS